MPDWASCQRANNVYNTVNSPNNGHFGTWASVLYSGSVLYWGVLIKSRSTPACNLLHVRMDQGHKSVCAYMCVCVS